jgi:very-short-patch-repair endonuclease
MGFVKNGIGMTRASHKANYEEELFEEAWKKAPTDIEIKRERGLEHRKNGNNYRYYHYYLDFAHEITKTAIEIDGGYHGTDEQKPKDAIRDQELGIRGWYTLRIPAKEVRLDAEWCARIVLRHIQTYLEQGRRLSFQELEELVPAPHRQRPVSVPQQPAQRPISVPQQPYTQRPFYTPQQSPVIPQQPYTQRPFYAPRQPPAQWPGYSQQWQYQQPPAQWPDYSQQWQPRQRRKLGFWWALLFGVVAGRIDTRPKLSLRSPVVPVQQPSAQYSLWPTWANLVWYRGIPPD